MTEKSVTTWKENMAFETDVTGHKFIVDALPEVGGQDLGPRPKALMLSALGGCTAMDVISILRKMRVDEDIADFKVHVEGDLTEEHPKYFFRVRVIYEFTPKTGKTLPLDKIEKAINLSEERYCGVAAVYKQTMEMSHQIKINEA